MQQVLRSAVWILLLLPAAALAEVELSKRQVIDLFTGKTVYYRDVPHSLNVVAYFDPIGEVRGLRGGKPYRQLWTVDGKGRHCTQDADEKRRCYKVFRRADGAYVKYRKGSPLVQYNGFEEGNPNNL
jgi:hypothetical protein